MECANGHLLLQLNGIVLLECERSLNCEPSRRYERRPNTNDISHVYDVSNMIDNTSNTRVQVMRQCNGLSNHMVLDGKH
jgi:hypothetical protein